MNPVIETSIICLTALICVYMVSKLVRSCLLSKTHLVKFQKDSKRQLEEHNRMLSEALREHRDSIENQNQKIDALKMSVGMRSG